MDIHGFNLVVLGIVAGVAAGALSFAVFHSVLVALPVGVVGGFAASRIPELLGGAGGSLFFGSGRTTPRPAEHSLAQALLAQGHLDAALEAYERAVAEDPGDPQPYIEIARLHRDRLDRAADALAWFRKAAAARRVTPAHEALIVRELTELCVHRLKQPLRAAPELSRLARDRAGTPDGEWARRELDRIRAGALSAERPHAPPGPEVP